MIFRKDHKGKLRKVRKNVKGKNRKGNSSAKPTELD